MWFGEDLQLTLMGAAGSLATKSHFSQAPVTLRVLLWGQLWRGVKSSIFNH